MLLRLVPMLAAVLAEESCAPSNSKSLLQAKVQVDEMDSHHRTAANSGACAYEIYIGRSDNNFETYWAKRDAARRVTIEVLAPKGETFSFGSCDTESAGGQACHGGLGIHVLRDSHGNEVGTGTCCSGLTNKVLRVISSCSDQCVYNLQIYRGGPDNFAKWFTKETTKPRGETFSFSGCIATTNNGQKCVTDHNVAKGVRYYSDSIGNRVGTGTCCNSETNKVEIISEVCPKMCSYTLHIISQFGGYTSSDGMMEMDLSSSNTIRASKIVHDSEAEEFIVDGCSADIPQGKACKDQHGVSGGVRLIKNKKGEVVATGDCCSSDTKNKVVQENGACS